nr:transposase [Streptomyces sp. NRRL F-7442]
MRVRGRSRRRISIAALTCYKPSQRSRLIYRPRRDDGNRDGRTSFSWRDYRDLLIAAHTQLGGPAVLVWDNLNVHKAAGLREFAETRDWLTIYYLPPYAPDPIRCSVANLSPAQGAVALLRRVLVVLQSVGCAAARRTGEHSLPGWTPTPVAVRGRSGGIRPWA